MLIQVGNKLSILPSFVPDRANFNVKITNPSIFAEKQK